MLAIDHLEGHKEKKTRSVGVALFWIVLMNLVFSFDSILSAIALTDNFWVMASAIVVSGLMMIYLADHVAEFLKKNRMYEVLGLFILFIVGVMLVSEGGHLAKLALVWPCDRTHGQSNLLFRHRDSGCRRCHPIQIPEKTDGRVTIRASSSPAHLRTGPTCQSGKSGLGEVNVHQTCCAGCSQPFV